MNRKKKYETFNHHPFYFIYLRLPWVFIAGCGLSLVAGTTPRCRAQASHCGGFSCCRAWALGPPEFSSVAHGLSYSKACGILPNQERNMSPASAGGFLNTGPLWKSPIVLFCFVFFDCNANEILVPLTGIEPKPSAVRALSPNHWPTRKFLIITEGQSRIETTVKTAVNISHLSSSQYAMVLMMYAETNNTRKTDFLRTGKNPVPIISWQTL